jgi:hypothetical protein
MPTGQPAIKIRPQKGTSPQTTFIASSETLTMRDYDEFFRVFINDWRKNRYVMTFGNQVFSKIANMALHTTRCIPTVRTN